ncbi:hypothetical protein QVD17_11167 [Tagetes erecta]|uniref:Uncharacterized protein n=1 Tax=Tagetes erecta TaxID=13708 RepID=A0AAD8L9A8_TARER|nr:hypothetical protein QVD17_11167 [Tagetes erecta]
MQIKLRTGDAQTSKTQASRCAWNRWKEMAGGVRSKEACMQLTLIPNTVTDKCTERARNRSRKPPSSFTLVLNHHHVSSSSSSSIHTTNFIDSSSSYSPQTCLTTRSGTCKLE